MKKKIKATPKIPGNWKVLPDYDGEYWVSDRGQVWSSRTEMLCLLRSDKKGGLTVQLLKVRSGCLTYHLVHKLVADLFTVKPRNAYHVVHINGDRMDNRVENLQWTSKKVLTLELQQATRKMEDPSMCGFRMRINLTPDQAIEIRDAIASGVSRRALAQHYGVCYATITNIVKRNTWAHL